MSTKTLIDQLVPLCPGYDRTGTRSILALVQESVDELWDIQEPGVHYIRGADNEGFPPYLTTQANVQEYEITSANLTSALMTWNLGGVEYPIRAKKVIKLFIDATLGGRYGTGYSTGYGYGRRFVGKPYVYSYVNPFSNSRTRLAVADVHVSSHPATENTPAKIIFSEDPGATTTEFFCLFTFEPPRLSSESIPLPVPKQYEQAIKDYVVGTVQQDANGRPSDRLYRFYNDSSKSGYTAPSWKDRFAVEMRSGVNLQSDYTPIRIA